MSAEDALLAIQEVLDGNAWTEKAAEEIVRIMLEAGYRIRDKNDIDFQIEDFD